jgi:hypothetical protein
MAHIREKAIQLRSSGRMSLDEIAECLALPKTTIYYWIKDIPLGRERDRTTAQKAGTAAAMAKYTAKREAAYQQGLAEAPALLQDPTFRDFVVLYMAEGTKTRRNEIALVNSDVEIVKLAHSWIKRLTHKPHMMDYRLQLHVDHDEAELKRFWAQQLHIEPERIHTMRKSNSNQLKGRKFRSVHGLLTVRIGDTYLRSRLQAWMDTVKSQW